MRERGTTKAYIIGFILSLVFTFIPYLMVVNQTISSTGLLAWILAFALLQMLIQIIFFLHLGRGPKPFYNIGFFVATFFSVLVVVAGSVFIISQLHANMTAKDYTTKLAEGEGISQVGGEQTGACTALYAHHKITISKGVVTPSHIDATRCDTLTFINQDEATPTLVFGPGSDREFYGGEDDVRVYKGHPKSITLNQVGTQQFHDEAHPETTGSFTVTAR